MTIAINQNTAAAAIGDRVDPGLGPKNPTIGQDRRAALPRDAGESTVSTAQDKAGKRKKNSAPTPAVPDDVIREVRIGSTIALLLAAGISARTLFQLGEIIGLPWQFAWMLPGAFDVYAYVSARVASRIPEAHRARKWAVWNARIALSFTMIGNALVHALLLTSHGQGWTGTDYALTAVSAIPPIIVERLLHLQTKIAADGTVPTVGADGDKTEAPTGKQQTPTKPRRQEVPTAPAANGHADASADAPTPSAPTADQNIGTVADDSADRGADVIDMATAGAAAKRNTDQWANEVLPTYRRFVLTRRRKPTAPELAEAIESAGLGSLGKSRARDVRAATEKLYDATDWDDDEAEAVNR